MKNAFDLVTAFTSAILCLSSFVFVEAVEYCYDSDNVHPQNSHFSSFTAYDYVRGNELDFYSTVPYCTPAKIWMLVRHGTRMPRDRDVDRFSKLASMRKLVIENYERLHAEGKAGELCDGDVRLIKEWRGYRNVTASNYDTLTSEGWREIKESATRFKRTFPRLFDMEDPSKYDFRYTDTPRCMDTLKAFIDGIFDRVTLGKFRATPNETLLRPYDYCPFWSKHYASQYYKTPVSEKWKVLESDRYKELAANVSRRLGFTEPLPMDSVLALDEMCRYETAWYRDSPSAWCSAFTPAQSEMFEYMNDVMDYYGSSYGFPLNRVSLGPLVLDMVKHLKSDGPVDVVANFGHSYSMKTFLTALGAMQDSMPLRADNYDRMRNRKFKTSILSPFGGTIVAVRYKCSRPNEEDKVRFFLNENRLDMDWCRNGLCHLSDVEDKYAYFKGDTLFNRVCSSANRIASASIGSLVFIFLLSRFLLS